jgi:hypothetical protein
VVLEMAARNLIVKEYARMWPREVFYLSEKGKRGHLAKGLELLSQHGGVYVLYREGVPYYVGKATRLYDRLWAHACQPGARYHNFWNHFSAFVIEGRRQMNQVEGILIAAMPTANGARPALKKAPMPEELSKMSRDIYRHQANPKLEFEALARHLVKSMEQLLRRQKRRKAA